MKPNKLVSIVMPTFNQGHFLNDALTSVVSQTYKTWELIIIDNYSSDNTKKVINKFKDPRIKSINFKNNGIIAASRNMGIQKAKGEYIAFLDSDDYWVKEKLEICMNNFDRNTDLLAHGLQFIGNRKGFYICGPNNKASTESLLRFGSCITPSATILRKEILLGVDSFSENINFTTAEDYHLWIKLAQLKVNMKFINDVLAKYRVHNSNNSNVPDHHLSAVIAVIDQFYFKIFKKTLINKILLCRRYALAIYGSGRTSMSDSRYQIAISFFVRSIIKYPLFVRSYLMLVLSIFYLLRIKYFNN